MGFRFRRSIKVLPGIRINLSKSGLSTSIGGPGATVNISERGTRTTVGIPGTGISYSETSHADRQRHVVGQVDDDGGRDAETILRIIVGVALLVIVCVVTYVVTSTVVR